MNTMEEQVIWDCSNRFHQHHDTTQLSDLPDDVISHIMSLLHPHNLSSVALVCKRWHSIARFFHHPNFKQSRFHVFDSFMNFVEDSLTQYLKHEPKTRKLKVSCHPGKSNTCRFNYLLDFTANNNFHELSLMLSEDPPLPLTTLGYKSLTRLVLEGECHIGDQLIDQIGDLLNLEVLELRSVYITGTTLSKFLTKCPSLVRLSVRVSVRDCKELVLIIVPPLAKLDTFDVEHVVNSTERMFTVIVEAPELRSFAFRVSGTYVDLPAVIDLQACRRKLHALCLKCYMFPIMCFDFPQLKSLYLSCMLTLSGHPTILTPNLCRFDGFSRDMKIISLPINAPELLKTKITVSSPVFAAEDWFFELRSHLTKLRKDATLCLDLLVRDYGEFGVVNDPPPRIKHLKIVANPLLTKDEEHSWPRSCKRLIDGIFLSCRPRTLSLKWRDEDKLLNRSLAKYLCSALEDRGCNYECKLITSWRRFLKCFEIKQVVDDSNKGHKKMVFSFEWFD